MTAKSVGSGHVAPLARQGPLLSWRRPGTSQEPVETSGTPSPGHTEGNTSRSESPDSSESFQPSEAHESADEISEPSSFAAAHGKAYSRLLSSGLLAPPCTNPRRTQGKRPRYVESDSESADSIED